MKSEWEDTPELKHYTYRFVVRLPSGVIGHVEIVVSESGQLIEAQSIPVMDRGGTPVKVEWVEE